MSDVILKFYHLFRKDIYTHIPKLSRSFLDDCLIKGVAFALCFGYLLPKAGGLGTLDIFLGNIIWVILPLPAHLAMLIMLDIKGNKLLAYQATIVKPWLVVVEKIIFISLFSLLVLIPFYPLGLALLGKFSIIFNISWLKLYISMFLGALFCSAYMVFFMLFLKGPESILSFWLRWNIPLVILGGSMAPLSVMKKVLGVFSPILYLNPFIYISDSIKGAILGGTKYIPLSVCGPITVLYSVLLSVLAIKFFKKRVDHI